MRPLYVVLLAILVATLLVVGYLLLKPKTGETPGGTTTNPFASTTAGTTGPQVSIVGTNGKKYTVPDFTAGKKADVLTAGTYYDLTNNQETQGANAEFEITYGTDSSIVISLVKEPLGKSRLDAEAALKQFIPLSNDDLCNLNAFVSTPSFVSDQYGGMSLGLSFCPGAVKLP